jgi:hypothetical protein
MTGRIVTTSFTHLSNADAAHAVLESSIRGVQVALEPLATPANDDAVPGIAAGTDDRTWELTASVPAGMAEPTATLLYATGGLDVGTES